MSRPQYYRNVADLVEDTLIATGRNVVLAMPIGAGQPVHLANEFYRRAKADPSIRLKLLSGLSLEPPRPRTELERRFWGPVIERLWPGVPYPEYIGDVRAGKLPDNVVIQEYFVRSGSFFNIPAIQQNYCSSNYTHIPRDMEAAGANVGAAQVSEGIVDGKRLFSISSNASASLDLMERLEARRSAGEAVELIGVLNRRIPFMYGTAVKDPSVADRILDNPDLYYPLFSTLREAIAPSEAMIGLYASALVPDGGTLQIGIGAVGDAIGEALVTRRRDNKGWRAALARCGALERFGDTIASVGSLDALPEGLYGCTEMMTHAFIRLIDEGVISRKVYDWLPLQTLAAKGLTRGEKVTPALLERLISEGRMHPYLREEELSWLRRFGVVKPACRVVDGEIECEGKRYSPNLADADAFRELTTHCLGEQLTGGVLIHAGFFMGPKPFYQALSDMPDAERQKIHMRAISYVNQVYGNEDLKRLQRGQARFFNTAMMLTALGAATSDMLENGQMVSGVGGQYNFVAMGHALEDGRSILMARAVREKPEGASSNVLWSYGHTTIPRHLRDIYITEYGIADVRSKSDQEVIKAMLAITDSRFQDALMETAKRNGKLDPNYRIPDIHRQNTPQRVADQVAQLRAQGLMPAYPTGADFSEDEFRLLGALRAPQGETATRSGSEHEGELSPELRRCLERMGLDVVRNDEEARMRQVLVDALGRRAG